MPGGGLGLGRPDQYLYPYYKADLEAGRLTRDQALAWMERFLLGFRHVDYYTPHQVYTPGSHGSLGGVTPTGLDASNELTELDHGGVAANRDARALYLAAAAQGRARTLLAGRRGLRHRRVRLPHRQR